jgi:hypothetical protein
MGVADWLGLGKSVAEPINAVGNLYTTDKARIEAEKDFQDVVNRPILAQISNNAIMAAAQSIFVSGWQPLIGWTAGFLVLLYYAPQIIITTFVWGGNCIDSGMITPFPMKPDDILNLVWLLFGFGVHSLGGRIIGKK